MKDTLIEIKNNLQGINSKVDEAKNQINDLEHKEAKNNQSEQQKEKWIQKNDDSVRNLCDNFKRFNIYIIRVTEGEEKEQDVGKLSEKMKENFPNLVKELYVQVQEAQRVLNKMDAKRPTPRNIIIEMPKVKDKERILKAASDKQVVITEEFP